MQGALADVSDLVQSARKLNRHLEVPRPARYWIDFLRAQLSGWASFYFTYNQRGRSLPEAHSPNLWATSAQIVREARGAGVLELRRS